MTSETTAAQKVTAPKPKARGVCCVMNADGTVSLAPELLANPSRIHPAIVEAMPDSQRKELGL